MVPRLLFGLLLTGLSGTLLHASIRRLLQHPSARPRLVAAFVASRVAGWAAIWVAFGSLASGSDLSKYYLDEATQAMAGRLPYRDFPSSYGPVFPYLAGILLPAWPSAAALAGVMVTCEVVSILAFHRATKDDHTLPAEAVNITLAAYTLSPAPLYWSGMLGYNSSVVLLFWVLALTALARQRLRLSLAWLAGSVAVGKLLGVLAAPVWLLRPNRQLRSLLVAGFVGGACGAALMAAGMDVTQPLRREGDRSTSGNLWFLASGLGLLSPDGLAWRLGPAAVFAAACAAYLWWLDRRWASLPAPTLAELCAAVGTIGWLFMMVSKKTYPHYTPMFVLPTMFAFASQGTIRWGRWILPLALAGALGIVEPGVWNVLGQPRFLGTEAGQGATAALLTGLDVALVALAGRFAVGLAKVSGRVSTAVSSAR